MLREGTLLQGTLEIAGKGHSTATAVATTATATATATAQQVWASMCVNRTQLEPFKTSGSGQRLCEFDTASKERAVLS